MDPTFDEFMWLDNNMSERLLKNIFGVDLGSHLYQKHQQTGNILYFYNMLDYANRYRMTECIRFLIT